MRLNKVQNDFKDLMLDHPDALNVPPSDFYDIYESGDVALPERLKIYRNNIVGSLTDVMVQSFPIINALVGEDFLSGMARHYVLNTPPQKGCLNTYGDRFDAFISEFKPAAALPYLPDVATFEIALNHAYYAKDDMAAMAEVLADIAPEMLADTVFYFRDSVRLISSTYPLSHIRDFCLTQNQEDTLDLDAGGQSLMIYRPALEVKIITVSMDEFLMLSALYAKTPLGDAVAQTMDSYPAFNIQAFLQKFIVLETFCDFKANAVI